MAVPPWKRPDNFSITAHQRLVDGQNRISPITPVGATEIYGSPHGTGIATGRRMAPLAMALIKITGAAAGGGKYTGTYWDRPITGAPAAGNLTEAELGTASAGAAVRLVNVREVGASTHDLTVGVFLPLIFLGLYRGTAADGVPVYAIDGRQSEDCT